MRDYKLQLLRVIMLLVAVGTIVTTVLAVDCNPGDSSCLFTEKKLKIMQEGGIQAAPTSTSSSSKEQDSKNKGSWRTNVKPFNVPPPPYVKPTTTPTKIKQDSSEGSANQDNNINSASNVDAKQETPGSGTTQQQQPFLMYR